MAFTDAFKAVLLDAQFQNGTVYVSLHSADPGTDGSNELTAEGGYARLLMEFNACGADGATENTNDETFGPASGDDWPEAGYFGLWSALSGGTFCGGFQLTTPKTVAVGETAKFPAGDLDVSI